jgi:hypothetical protein
MGTAPDRTRCPECKKLSNRKWDVAPPVIFKGAGWTGRNKVTGFNKAGGSDVVNKELQRGSEERMESGWQHYAKFTPPKKLLDKCDALSSKQLQQRLEATKINTDRTYNNAGIDPNKKYKPQ